MPVADDALAARFTEHRAYLLAVAYRLTSTLADAEDAVQEAWLRLASLGDADRDAIRDLRAWLATVVGRICLDRLRSATVRRERYVGPWLPEPVVTPLPGQPGEDPLDAVVRDDRMRMAALVLLDRLTPEQRVAFVLHDALALPFAEIADVLGCTPEAARQHASRGRRAVAEGDAPDRLALSEQQDFLGRFVAAVSTGDVPAVVALLHPDVVVVGDGGGRARTARRAVTGRDQVARFLIGLLRRYGPATTEHALPVLVNGDLGLVVPASPGDEEFAPLDGRVMTIAIRDGLLAAVYDVVNPDKLTRLDAQGRTTLARK